MSKLQIFSFAGQDLEWFTDSDNNPACQAQQLGLILGFTPSYIPKIVDRIYPKFKFQDSMGKSGRPAWYLREPGIYQMIFESKSDVAQKFQLWVFEEVLPKLRADGGYIMPTATSEELQGLRSQIDRYESRLNGILDSFAKIDGDWQNHKHPRLVVLAQQELVRSQHTVEEKEMVRKLFQIHSTSIAPESWIPIAQLAKFTKEFTEIDVPHGLLTVWLAEWGHPYRGRYSDMYSVLMNVINEKTRQKIKEHSYFAAKKIDIETVKTYTQRTKLKKND
jgi:prophage antirepressor-like protein